MLPTLYRPYIDVRLSSLPVADNDNLTGPEICVGRLVHLRRRFRERILLLGRGEAGFEWISDEA